MVLLALTDLFEKGARLHITKILDLFGGALTII